jgi:DNA mismatch repair protein MutL
MDSQGIIKVMPDTLANKIAAGEVVQRPASAAKELIENALDAGASQVDVVLKGAGSELIQVVDDGSGMTPHDAALCFRRHATSKITSIDDLERILTLGFRGEALASIGAVAQVDLRTKRVGDDVGFCVRVEGGTTTTAEPCAAPNGTSVAVRNLFYNVPARRNFLKTPATEFKHLVETFQFLALSHPAVGFTLVHDDNEVYRLPPARSDGWYEALRLRIRALFGEEWAGRLVDVEETTSYLSVRGVVGRPDVHRRSRGEQFLFVNGRFVKNRYLDHAVLAAFEGLLPDGAFPFFALFLRMDPRHVDVNVHPTKAEVKFDDERGIYGFLRSVVKKALGMADLTPQLGTVRRDAGASEARPRPIELGTDVPRASFPAFRTGTDVDPGVSGRSATSRPDAGAPGERARPWTAPGELSARLYQGTEQAQLMPSSTKPVDDTGEETGATDAALLWQLHDAYILTQIRSGLMIIDQNAAHERILYEQALESMRNGFGLSQQLLFPQTLDFQPADLALLKDLLPDLRSLGFDLEFFSGRSVVVRGVPADIQAGDERTMLDDLLQQYKSYRDALQLKGRDNLAKSIARRSAIPHGVRLDAKAMRSLIDKLFLCEMPYACPHGRPTMIKISIEELEKRFSGPA